ncbi:uncharacterized protein LOC121599017 [Anopheles merus]|uniref:uncharacterized protein LOC121599017 n=1 Tax=Anopheles merus TaxID=30066 RepID=UPI001BE4B577|nr:uncharacterized protein LOC121599017 [Anopheles merus]XP_041782410.1 uncharacterized protein LOC121599017 [Anopheles merus]XP_041782411.1 uncharacterized protein LOC121599017 [Anopheles merus]XP_041782412.1 uncharacterized protein LOC121599017 [Anopheles merus]XP_041782413.1 uncharacterized protein LOC121599017 [Anopheles merus]XP_041782414.1 uncharacterized protein LOC121599017 [Anopheles merus]XP_041782415.1 uncharacterized protein LOC121599017 [Anopheles merus]XP_041782416.1 uncharacte
MNGQAQKRKASFDHSATAENNGSIPSASKISRPSDENEAKGTSSYHGMFYHLQLGMIILLRAFNLHCERQLSKFEITMENKDGGKFDDIVLHYENATVPKGTVYIQAKHKVPVGKLKCITHHDLLSGPTSKGPYSIPTYFASYLELQHRREDASEHNANALKAPHRYVLCTNVKVDDKVTIIVPLAQPSADGISPLLESIGGKSYIINQQNNTIQNRLRKTSLEELGKMLASCIKDKKEINGEDCYIFQLYSDLIAACVEKVKPGVYKLIEQPQSTAGKTLAGMLQTSLGSKKDKSNAPKEKPEVANILIASSFEKLFSNSRVDEPYGKVDAMIQQFSDKFLLVCGTKNDTELLEQALELMPPWVNDKKDKFENLQNILLHALRENPRDDINLENIKKKFIELKVNDSYCKIEEFTKRYLDSESNLYSTIALEPCSLRSLKIHNFFNENSCDRIHRYYTTANMKMSSVIVQQTAQLLDYNCLIVDSTGGQFKDNLCTVLSDVMKFISEVGLSTYTIITILGALDEELFANIENYARADIIKLIVIEQVAENDPPEDCLLVSDLTKESREQLFERYKQLFLFETTIALNQIVRKTDSLSMLCKVLDRYGHQIDQNEVKNINQRNFQTISSWFIPRTLQPYNDDETKSENSVVESKLRFDGFHGNYSEKPSFDSLILPGQDTVERLDLAITSQASLICQMPYKFSDQSKVHIILDDAGCGKTSYFTWLASHLSRNDPSLCVIRMHAFKYSADFNELQKAHLTSLDDTTTIRILLRLFQLTLFATTVSILSAYESNEIRNQAKQTAQILAVSGGKVALDDGTATTLSLSVEQLLVVRLFVEKLNSSQFVIIFDGFDEIAPHYKDFVMSYLGRLATFAGIYKLYISSRPYNFIAELKKTFHNCEIYQLSPFSMTDQLNLLYNYLWRMSADWKKCNKNDRYRVLYLLYVLNFRSMSKLMSTPLFLHMRCAMLLPILERYVDFSSRTVERAISDQQYIDQLQLVTNFVEQKLQILNADKCGTTDTALLIPALQQLTLSANKDRKEKLKLFAILTLFDEEERKRLLSNEEQLLVTSYIKEILQGSEKTGIVLGVLDDIPQFGHRIFAEYFAACWLFGNKDRFREVDFFRSRSYWTDEFSLLRDFFDRMVLRESIGCELHMAVLNRSNAQVDDILHNSPVAVEKKDALGRLPLHLAVVDKRLDTIEQLLENLSEESINVKDGLLGWSALDYAFVFGKIRMILTLLKHKAIVHEQTLLELTVASKLGGLLTHADLCGQCLNAYEHTKMFAESFHRRVVEYLLNEKRVDIFHPQVDLHDASIVEAMIVDNMQDLFKQFVIQSRGKIEEAKFIALLEKPGIYRTHDTTMIIASELNVSLPKAVDNEAIIGTLKFAIERKNMNSFILLFKQLCFNLNIHTVEDMEDIPSVAEEESNLPPMIVDICSSFCCINQSGDETVAQGDVIESLLIYAVREGNLHVIRYIACKTNTIIQNELIRTIMHWLVKLKRNLSHERCIPAFKYLLHQSIDLHSIDNEGSNLLHWTAQNGCVFMLHCLIDKGFDLSEMNSTNGWNAFHYVAFFRDDTWAGNQRKYKLLEYIMEAYQVDWFGLLTSMFDPNKFGSLAVSLSPNQHSQYKNIVTESQVCLMAMFVLFDKPTRSELLTSDELRDGDQCLQDIEKASDLTGIVQGVRDGIPQFCHRIFAEYFAACWLFDNKDRFRKGSFFRSSSYWTDQFSRMRDFFDRMVLKESIYCELHMAVLNQSEEKVLDVLFIMHYAFAYENNESIDILLDLQATVDENVLVEQTVANDLRDLLNHAHICFKCLETHDYTKLASDRFQTSLAKYLIDEKRVDIFSPLPDLQNVSVLHEIVRCNIYVLFEQIVLQLSDKIPQETLIAVFEVALKYRAINIATIIASELNDSLLKEVDNETLIDTVKCAIKNTNMKALIVLFQQLCINLNIHTVEDMEESMHCDVENDCDLSFVDVNHYPSNCCIPNHSLCFEDEPRPERDVIKRLLIYALKEVIYR